jgi:AcrR family transcriptional regulator
MATRREELTRIAARLFAERGYQGTSLADLAQELGMQKPSLYHHISSKEDLLWEVAWEGAEAFHAALDGVPADVPATDRIRLALRAHLAVVAGQLDVATVFVREWRYLEGATGSSPSAAATRSGSARSTVKGSSGASCAPTSTSRPRA